jgi:phosphotransferase system enzyme I (PtsP)
MITILRKIIQKVHNAADFDSALKLLVKEVKVAMNTQVCSLYLLDKEKGGLVLRATEGLRKSSIGKARLASSEGLVGLVADREEPINLKDASSHPSFQFIEGTGEERYSAFLGVPIIHQKIVLGVLVVQQKEARSFDSEEEAFLVTIAAQLAAEVAHADATGALVRKKPQKRTRLREAKFLGIPGSAGVSMAEALVVYPQADLSAVPERFVDKKGIEAELDILSEALTQVRKDIKNLQKKVSAVLPKEEQALFSVYLDILADNALGGEIAAVVKEGHWAQGAIKNVVQTHVRAFEEMDDPYMSERAVDVRDLGIRLLAELQNTSGVSGAYPEQCILVGEEITTSQLLDVPPEKLRGIVSVTGSSNSHMSIVARALGVPTVVGAVDLPFDRLHGRELIVDGFEGFIYCDPGSDIKVHYRQVIEEEALLQANLELEQDKPTITLDGHRVELWVNTGLMIDISRSIERGAEGVGLYRTEIPFMIRDRFPSEREQVEIYKEQLQIASPKIFTMRTLDIGGDKSLPYFPIEEDNPFLGWRGIRITLDHPELLLVQVRAMMIASEGLNNLRILIPMVTNVFEIDECLVLIRRAYEELLEEGFKIAMPEIGVMIEIPAAAYQAKAFADRVDFISVGSNDLTQYLLAVDRNNPRVADLYESFHPALLNALRYIVIEAKRAKKPVSICGELAGDPRAAVLLTAMGFDSLSMSASQLLRVKYTLRHLSLIDCQKLLKEVLEMDNGSAILEHLSNFFNKAGLSHLVR